MIRAEHVHVQLSELEDFQLGVQMSRMQAVECGSAVEYGVQIATRMGSQSPGQQQMISGMYVLTGVSLNDQSACECLY
jgi:hypothetical protein